MKKLIIISLGLVMAIQSIAQDKPIVSEEKNVLKANSLSLIFGTGSIFYEREFKDNISGQLGVAYLNYKIDETTFSGLILTPEVRFYVKKNAIDGFYIAPYIRYSHFGLKNGSSEANFDSFGGGAAFGRQWIFNSGFVIDFFMGGTYSSGKLSGNSGNTSFDTNQFEGFRPRIGLALGFAF